jgi:hypothetical protein
MHYRSTLIALVAVGLLTSACATGRGNSQDALRVEPPTLVRGPGPDWRLPSPPREGIVLDLRVEVQVDSTGRADPETLRLTGVGAPEHRDAVATWLRNARFRPARQAGRAVPGVFRTRVELRAEVRRVG